MRSIECCGRFVDSCISLSALKGIPNTSYVLPGNMKRTVSAVQAELFIKMDICIWIELVVSAFHPALKPCDVKDGAGARDVQPEPAVVNHVSANIWHHMICIVNVLVLLPPST